jgi:hypothetical protein
MLDMEKIRKSVAALGWPKAAYSACLVLLVAHVISFDQCLVLLLIALVVELFPFSRIRTQKTKSSGINS